MKRATSANRLFLVLSLLLLIGIALKLSSVHEKDLDYYTKAKSSRRGEVRKAKESKKSMTFSQQRQGVQRTLWFDETNGIRRQFHLEANEAVVDLVMAPSGLEPQETFFSPHGWLQQKVGWQMPDGEEIEKEGDSFCYSKTKRPLSEAMIETKVPFQVVRYYDAAKAIWDINHDTLTLYKVIFTDFRKMDHSGTFDTAEGQQILKGFADEMTFHFKASGKEEVTSTGLKLKLVQGL